MSKRALRRHKTRTKYKKRAENYFLLGEYLGSETKMTLKEFMEENKWVKLLRDKGQLCSCEICGNPRRSDWVKKKEKLTIQERLIELKTEEELKELEEVDANSYDTG